MSASKPSSGSKPSQAELDHRATQLNPNSDEYWKSRGHPARPEDWENVKPEAHPPPKQDE